MQSEDSRKSAHNLLHLVKSSEVYGWEKQNEKHGTKTTEERADYNHRVIFYSHLSVFCCGF